MLGPKQNPLNFKFFEKKEKKKRKRNSAALFITDVGFNTEFNLQIETLNDAISYLCQHFFNLVLYIVYNKNIFKRQHTIKLIKINVKLMKWQKIHGKVLEKPLC